MLFQSGLSLPEHDGPVLRTSFSSTSCTCSTTDDRKANDVDDFIQWYFTCAAGHTNCRFNELGKHVAVDPDIVQRLIDAYVS